MYRVEVGRLPIPTLFLTYFLRKSSIQRGAQPKVPISSRLTQINFVGWGELTCVWSIIGKPSAWAKDWARCQLLAAPAFRA